MSENGAVKRGVCAEKDGLLTELIESYIERKDGKIIASPLDGSEPFEIGEETPVSMNMLCFTKDIFKYLEDHLKEFFETNKDNLLKCDYLIPDSVYNSIKEGISKVYVVPTTAKWQGITYKEDKEKLVNEINGLIEQGVYPQNLWK